MEGLSLLCHTTRRQASEWWDPAGMFMRCDGPTAHVGPTTADHYQPTDRLEATSYVLPIWVMQTAEDFTPPSTCTLPYVSNVSLTATVESTA
jgi:hypothetical protein